jgi:hypothetical protein
MLALLNSPSICTSVMLTALCLQSRYQHFRGIGTQASLPYTQALHLPHSSALCTRSHHILEVCALNCHCLENTKSRQILLIADVIKILLNLNVYIYL